LQAMVRQSSEHGSYWCATVLPSYTEQYLNLYITCSYVAVSFNVRGWADFQWPTQTRWIFAISVKKK